MVDLILQKFKLGDISMLDKSNLASDSGIGILSSIAEHGILYFTSILFISLIFNYF